VAVLRFGDKHSKLKFEIKMKIHKIKFLFITNNPEIAQFAVSQGVDRIFVDLEILGKVERQGHLNTVISRHAPEDISLLRPLLPRGALLVRLNPVNPNTEMEVEDAIKRGADVLMLPMFRGAAEVRRFCQAVDSRVKVCLLVETVDAMKNLAECVEVPGVDEVHIGLNDLHLELGCRFMFEPLVSGHVERMTETIRKAGIPFGIGGLARVGEGMLAAEVLLSEHARLGSTGAILSRTFHRQAGSVEEIQAQMNFAHEVQKLRTAYEASCLSTTEELNLKRELVKAVVADIAAKQPNRQQQDRHVL
jgi:2-keto-3-deoxy-L-rhamnonate aldolase RhmA